MAHDDGISNILNPLLLRCAAAERRAQSIILFCSRRTDTFGALDGTESEPSNIIQITIKSVKLKYNPQYLSPTAKCPPGARAEYVPDLPYIPGLTSDTSVQTAPRVQSDANTIGSSSSARSAANDVSTKRPAGARIERVPDSTLPRCTSSADSRESIHRAVDKRPPPTAPRPRRLPGARREYLPEPSPERPGTAVSDRSVEFHFQQQSRLYQSSTEVRPTPAVSTKNTDHLAPKQTATSEPILSPRSKRSGGARKERLAQLHLERPRSPSATPNKNEQCDFQQDTRTRTVYKSINSPEPPGARPKRAAGARSELVSDAMPSRQPATKAAGAAGAAAVASKNRSPEAQLRQQLIRCTAEQQALVKENRDLLTRLGEARDFIRDLQTENEELQQQLQMHRCACKKNKRVSCSGLVDYKGGRGRGRTLVMQ